MNPLVSIISPCYNGELYIDRFLDSILAQTYPNIEVIIINDGSKDNTEAILMSYKEKFKNRGYHFTYIYQENAGQSAAINQGLKVFQGVYMTWVDSDDYLMPDAISEKVAYMENHPTVGLAICKIKVVDHETNKEIREQVRIRPQGPETFFYDLISGKNVFYTPGGYFVRSDMFRDAMPKPLRIEAPRETGQNFQLLLPIAYKYPIGYVDKFLYKYSVRLGSHSRVKHTFEDRKKKIEISHRVLSNIMNQIDFNSPQEKETAMNAVECRIIKSHLLLMLEYNRRDGLKEISERINQLGLQNRSFTHMILRIKYPWINWGYRVLFKR